MAFNCVNIVIIKVTFFRKEKCIVVHLAFFLLLSSDLLQVRVGKTGTYENSARFLSGSVPPICQHRAISRKEPTNDFRSQTGLAMHTNEATHKALFLCAIMATCIVGSSLGLISRNQPRRESHFFGVCLP